MFKTTLAAAIFSIMPVLAQAQETMFMAIMSDCAITRSVKQFIYQELQEIPFSGGWGILQRGDGEFAEGIWKIYTSPDWTTFTIAIEFPDDGVMCLVGMGNDLEPFEDRSFR